MAVRDYPDTTGMQVAYRNFAALLEQARDCLSAREYEAFLDLATRLIARENGRFHRSGWLEERRAA
jgi:hypothetical protein